MTQLRFKKGAKLDGRLPLYLRDNGTRTFFFSIEYLTNVLVAAGYQVLMMALTARLSINFILMVRSSNARLSLAKLLT